MPTASIDVRELLKAGAHFGHRAARWNPKMEPYIHSQREGIYIIDLIKTVEHLERALDFVEKTASEGKQILFVGTKRHLRESVKTAAESAKMPYVIERWFGGTLTNFSTIGKRVKYLRETEEELESGKLAETMSKREIGEVREDLVKLNTLFGGLKTMTELPAALFVVDAITDSIAIREAVRLSIPIVAIVDTNADPEPIDYVVAANDDAINSVSLIGNLVAEGIARGRARIRKTPSKPADKPAHHAYRQAGQTDGAAKTKQESKGDAPQTRTD